MNNITRFNELLMSTNREGMPKLLDAMQDMGFYSAPCSSHYHLARSGGLLEHSLHVCDTSLALVEGLEANIPKESVIIAALLHDLGKAGDHGKRTYLLNNNVAKPFKTNSDLLYIPHEVRSVIIANRYIRLTEDEEYAIYYHNGKYNNIGETLKDHRPLEMIIHFADMYSCFELEKEK